MFCIFMNIFPGYAIKSMLVEKIMACLIIQKVSFMVENLVASDQRMVIFPANRNRNRFAEPSSVQIGIGIVLEFQNLRIGIGIVIVRWEVFANYSRMHKIIFFCIIFSLKFFSFVPFIFSFEKLTNP